MTGLLSRLNFLRQPAHEALPHVVVKYVAATKRESKAAARKREETTAELKRIVAEQRLVAAIEATRGVKFDTHDIAVRAVAQAIGQGQ
jgi:hypothetical protein